MSLVECHQTFFSVSSVIFNLVIDKNAITAQFVPILDSTWQECAKQRIHNWSAPSLNQITTDSTAVVPRNLLALFHDQTSIFPKINENEKSAIRGTQILRKKKKYPKHWFAEVAIAPTYFQRLTSSRSKAEECEATLDFKYSRLISTIQCRSNRGRSLRRRASLYCKTSHTISTFQSNAFTLLRTAQS